MDPASNAMYIPKGCTGVEFTVLLSATSTYDGHVLYQRKGSIKVDGGLVNARVEDLNKCRALIGFIL